MGKKNSNNHLYVGRAGHLAVMAECLSRGWNVAIPEVDVGEDIFVVEDEKSQLAKIQVKTGTGKKSGKGFSSQFELSLAQLENTTEKGNDLRYVFVVRYKRKWQPYVIIKREDLLNKHRIEQAGSFTAKTRKLTLTLYYRQDAKDNDKIVKIEAGTKRGFSMSDFSVFMEDWSVFFDIRIQEGNIV